MLSFLITSVSTKLKNKLYLKLMFRFFQMLVYSISGLVNSKIFLMATNESDKMVAFNILLTDNFYSSIDIRL